MRPSAARTREPLRNLEALRCGLRALQNLALAQAWALSLPVADAALRMVLSASASYIVVPAVLRYAIPEANPALDFGLSLGITFPLNLLVGIPVYTAVARSALGRAGQRAAPATQRQK